ncbi:MAG: pyridoxamine 5'-phosphate oxidase family protein [Yoonia sp.]|uniref:HugZ family pyridoxamine 5'-phosphate oxidase n=1 Tax=Yoonia sp. TaxID=2212373 RepID=UPI00273FF547|nr:pyridoxamine 5'-phosphate oxidase family protein [Yoonia sp.]MDP5085290.1 pyridoxamine 5'-phosphate oxidase family protein [Yoonia sp.]
MPKPDPINPTDADARALAQQLLAMTRFGALAVTHPESGTPYVARVAMIWTDGAILSLISTLSTHTKALQANPACAVLVGEPGVKGDPLTHPRMTLTCMASLTDKAAFKGKWLNAIPKAQLYYDFTDFLMFRLTPQNIDLNGGFGKAFRLTPQDLLS